MAGLRVLIAGGGVAAAEGLLALHRLAEGRVQVELFAPNDRFVYRPHLVDEPFSRRPAPAVALRRLASEHRAFARRDSLASADAGSHQVRTRAGMTIGRA